MRTACIHKLQNPVTACNQKLLMCTTVKLQMQLFDGLFMMHLVSDMHIKQTDSHLHLCIIV